MRSSRSRAPSVSSAGVSVASSLAFPIPTAPKPPPAYVAVAAASDLVTEHHLNQARALSALGTAPSIYSLDESAVVTEDALALLNAFLDYILYSILATAKGTSVPDLRRAIEHVLKSKLARTAIALAEEEFSNLHGDHYEEEPLPSIESGEDASSRQWNLERAWKRIRLRIMAYTSLGEMEEEDEEEYIEQDETLSFYGEDARYMPAAIYLAPVVESLAEQAIEVAGEAAYAKELQNRRQDLDMMDDGRGSPLLHAAQGRVVVEKFHMEQSALKSGLGRLWRTWKRHARTPSAVPPMPTAASRRGSVSSMYKYPSSPPPSLPMPPLMGMGGSGTVDGAMRGFADSRLPPLSPVPHSDGSGTSIAAKPVPPTTKNNIAEPEVSSTAREVNGVGSDVAKPAGTLATQAPTVASPSPVRPSTLRRNRSSSSPAAIRAPVASSPAMDRSIPSTVSISGTAPEEKSNAEESKVSEHREQHGGVTGVITGATSLLTSAIASVVGMGKGEEHPASDRAEPNAAKTPTVADEVPQVLESRRVSLGHPPSPPAVMTVSRNDSNPSTPNEPNKVPLTERLGGDEKPDSLARAPQDHTDKYDSGAVETDSQVQEDRNIGVARTSDVPVRPPPSPTPERNAVSPFGVSGMQRADRNSTDSTESSRNFNRFSGSPPSARNAASPTDYDRSPDAFTSNEGGTPSRTRPGSHRNAQLSPLREDDLGTPTPYSTFANAASQLSNGKPHAGTYTIGQPITVAGLSEPDGFALPEKSKKRLSLGPAGGGRPGLPPFQMGGVEQASATRPPSSTYSSASGHRDSQSSLALAGRGSPEVRTAEFDSLVGGDGAAHDMLTPLHEVDQEAMVRPLSVHHPGTADPIATSIIPPAASGPTSSAMPRPSEGVTTNTNQDTVSPVNNGSAIPASTQDSTGATTRPPLADDENRKSGLLAREARVQSASMRDFTDFIRSTGPNNEASGRRASGTSLTNPTAPITAMPANITTRPSRAKSQPEAMVVRPENAPPVPGFRPQTATQEPRNPRGGPMHPSRNILNFDSQAPPQNPRPQGSPVHPRRNILNFDSQMPPQNSGQGGPTHPGRSAVNLDNQAPVHPSRRVMNFDGQPPQQNLKPHSGPYPVLSKPSPPRSPAQESRLNLPAGVTNYSDVRGPSERGTVPNQRATQPAPPAQAQAQRPQQAAVVFPQISTLAPPQQYAVRKRRQVTDPYAIASDDEYEDSDDEPAAPAKSRGRQEESLIEFLRNVQPPARNAPAALAGPPNGSALAGPRAANGVNGSAHRDSPPHQPHQPHQPAAARPAITSTVSSESLPKPGRRRSRSADPKRARTARADPANTNDLADFIRSSGPNDDLSAAPPPAPPPATSRADRTKSGRFWRRKTTYLDMP